MYSLYIIIICISLQYKPDDNTCSKEKEHECFTGNKWEVLPSSRKEDYYNL